MPFIKPITREYLALAIDQLNNMLSNGSQGNVAYTVYKIVKREESYTAISRARAVLHDVLDILNEEYLEYERQKRTENGPIV